MSFQRDPAVVQSIQRFERMEIDLAGDYNELPDGRRYVDFTVQGDSIYIPPESVPVPVQVFLSDQGYNRNKQIPNLYPGGNVVGIYRGGRIVFPASGTGTIIVILSEGMKFSSGSILLNAPAQVPATPDGDYVKSCLSAVVQVVFAGIGSEIAEIPINIVGPGFIDGASIVMLQSTAAGYGEMDVYLSPSGQRICASTYGYAGLAPQPRLAGQEQSWDAYFPIEIPADGDGDIYLRASASAAGTYTFGFNIYARCVSLQQEL